MKYFPTIGKKNNARPIIHTSKDLLLKAAKTRNFQLFAEQAKKVSEIEYNNCDIEGMSPLHLILQQSLFEISTRKKRENIYEILKKILSSQAMKTAWLNSKDKLGRTPLHLATIAGYSEAVTLLLEHKADYRLQDNKGSTALKLAAESAEDEIYKALMTQHKNQNAEFKKNNQVGGGYTLDQINSALAAKQKSLRKRNALIGGIGAFMVIACPVATILAFDDIPLIGGILASFVPGIGPIIGLVTGLVFAGLLIWAVHQKSSLKYGEHGQKLAEIEAKNAHLDRLSADLNHLQQLEQNIVSKTFISNRDVDSLLPKIQKQLEEKRQEIKNFCATIPKVERINKIKKEDWATSTDVLKTRLLTAGSFFCAFSGVLGICSGLSTFLPAAAFASVVLAGIPVAGWIALGIALVVATGVAVWAHHVKFKQTLQEYGKARKELNLAESQLYERSVAMCEEKSLKNVFDFELVPKKVTLLEERKTEKNTSQINHKKHKSKHTTEEIKNENPQKTELIVIEEKKQEKIVTPAKFDILKLRRSFDEYAPKIIQFSATYHRKPAASQHIEDNKATHQPSHIGQKGK